jgi:hypothetical protein
MNRHEQADQRDEAAAEGRLQTMALALIRGGTIWHHLDCAAWHQSTPFAIWGVTPVHARLRRRELAHSLVTLICVVVVEPHSDD